MEIQEIEYQRHGFTLSRKKYLDLPEELKVTEIGQIIQQVESQYDEEFKVLNFKDDEVHCVDIHSKIERDFYLDSVRISEKELKRQKRAKIAAKKSEAKRKRQEKEKKRAERAYQKSIREDAKRKRALDRTKKKELNIKFI